MAANGNRRNRIGNGQSGSTGEKHRTISEEEAAMIANSAIGGRVVDSRLRKNANMAAVIMKWKSARTAAPMKSMSMPRPDNYWTWEANGIATATK